MSIYFNKPDRTNTRHINRKYSQRPDIIIIIPTNINFFFSNKGTSWRDSSGAVDEEGFKIFCRKKKKKKQNSRETVDECYRVFPWLVVFTENSLWIKGEQEE